ncbi:SusC/RagA family TonB-linked outer membrane protein [Chitinophaga sp.]|uniref:SusC/RagA family TonB-linked outer membrane protein n=1 Tax=Chitinophaga sp. TaxID=1869181 RepID=UPI0026158D2E|nr:SusC/RagA family TonB-linked outer membrane protein [uncultured Chitinophaga sp.]
MLRSIEKQSGYTFFFSAVTLDVKTPVSINVKQASLEKVLDELLKPFKVSYFIKDKSIIIRRLKEPEKKPEIFSVIDTVPNVAVSGKVVDSKGASMPGVTVSVKGKSVNSITDAKGDFFFPAIPSDATLVFSNIGYERQELKIKGSTVISIALKERVTDLEKVEIVSTGYQNIPKERVTGSVTVVDNKSINRRVGSSILERIEDMVPGLLKATRNSRAKDDLSSYTIRGLSSFNADSKPLLIVDNFIYDGDPNDINPNDVENITVLKDAAAASIWGVRAGNGVIVINMKKGQRGKNAAIKLSSHVKIIEKPQWTNIPSIPSSIAVNTEQELYNRGYYAPYLENSIDFPPVPLLVEILERKKQGHITEDVANKLIQQLKKNDIRRDVEKYLYRNTFLQQYAVNISGSANNYQYYASIGFDKSNSEEINNNQNRFSLRLNNSWNPIRNLQITGDINWTNSKASIQNEVTKYISSITGSPYNQLKKNDQLSNEIPHYIRLNYLDTVSFPGKLDWHLRPIDEIKNNNNTSESNNLRFNGNISYNFLKYFQVQASYQWQKTIIQSSRYLDQSSYEIRNTINKYVTTDPNTNEIIYPVPLGDTYSNNNSQSKAWNLRGQLNYSQSIKEHNVSSILGIETREQTFESYGGPTQYGFDPETYTFRQIIPGNWTNRPQGSIDNLSPEIGYRSGSISRFGSYYINASYSYARRYTVYGSARIDQSNFFGVSANDRIVPLWSSGISWTINEESFHNLDWNNSLTIRASYGYNGNTQAGISPLATATYLQPTTPLFLPHARIVNPPNPQLKWERVRQINFGIDFGFLNIISGSIELYRKKGIDLISSITAAPTTGFEFYNGNNSELESKGIDINIKSNFKWGKLSYSPALLFSYNTNEVKSFSIEPPTGYIAPYGYTGNAIPIIGKPLDKIYSFRWGGLNSTNGDANFVQNGRITESNLMSQSTLTDYKYNGRSVPPIFGYFRNEFTYKNISASISLSYRFGHYFRRTSFSGGLSSTFAHIDYLQAWKTPGDETKTNVPGYLDSYSDHRYDIYSQSDILVEKADDIRLQDIKLNYIISKQNCKWLPISNINLFLFLDNLGFIWKESTYNPDTQNTLTPNGTAKTGAMGINITF